MRKLLLPFSVTLAMMCVLMWQGRPLQTELTPRGIIALEFADNLRRLYEVLTKWDIYIAKTAVYLDTIYLLAFGWLFFTGAKLVHQKCKLSILKSFTRTAIYLSLLPSLFDITENISMLITLYGTRSEALLHFTTWVDIFKFALSAMVILYLLVSLLIIYAKSKKSAIRKKEELFSRP